MADLSDDELLDALGVEAEPSRKSSRTPREERIIAGFEDIQRFFDEHGHIPAHGEDKDIFESLYAVRLDRIRALDECRELLKDFDRQGLLEGEFKAPVAATDMDDDALLRDLSVEAVEEGDITQLKHVKPRAEVRAAEEIASRTPCKDFDTFKPKFELVQNDLKEGIRESRRFGEDADIAEGEFFILGGQTVYVDQVGEEFLNQYDRKDRRLRVIYSNGTESDILLRSFQRALYKDEAGRRITDPVAGPLFASVADATDSESGTVYVLRSKSDHPLISSNRDVIHKIGVTGSKIETRIANAKLDATFLMAEVEVIATYELFNINRSKLENLIHRFFTPARIEIEIKDRFGIPIKPMEWFLVPLQAINEAIERIQDGSIAAYQYDPKEAKLKLTE
jgi:T5orf172 domain